MDAGNPLGQSLQGQRVCVTGTLAAMSHAEFAVLVAKCGGQFLPQPVRDKFLLVVGSASRPGDQDGSASATLQRARDLQLTGYPIAFLSEEEFFARIGLIESKESLAGRYTIAELSRLLGMSAASLRRWTKLGLIRPMETVHGFPYFSFAEVASARRLCELVASGASPTRIKQSLERFRAWLPLADLSFSQLSLEERGGQVLMRLNNVLVEPSGQRHFDFETDDEDRAAVSFPTFVETALPEFDSLFDQALALEDQGKFLEAAETYRQASTVSPNDPAVYFNLGNVLYELGNYDESLNSFREALRCDPHYAEAWNNLGNVLWRTGATSGAMQAFSRAIALVPDYLDARRNLESLRQRVAAACFRIVS